MSRDDSDLYSGISSASYEKVAARQAEAKAEKDKARAQVELDAPLILKVIAEERAECSKKLWDWIKPDTTEETVKASIVALKEYDGYLAHLSSRINTIIRTRKGQRDE